MSQRQAGFTLVEIAIVLVIIGLLLGGVLKGQELINSARVRNMADTASGIQSAYFGFVDRYRRVPGDWNAAAATRAIGVTVSGGGNDDGRLSTPAGDLGNVWAEPNALWEQLSKAGFIQGDYDGTNAEPTTDNNLAPLNVFNRVITMGRTTDYEDDGGAPPVRLNLVMGRGVPVNIMRELDTKLDDGRPSTGVVRATVPDASVKYFGSAGGSVWGGRDAACVDIAVSPAIWDVNGDSQDCNAVFLY